MNFFNIPLCWPFKMIPDTLTPGIHFDDAWQVEQLKSFEQPVKYWQKWEKGDTTALQIESSISPEALKVYNEKGKVVKTFDWTPVFTATDYRIWEVTFDISDLPDGLYWLFQRVAFDNEITPAIDWQAISEPLWSKSKWPNTLPFLYYNTFNDFDVAWSTGIKMLFRCEAAIMDAEFPRNQTDYIDQIQDKTVLSGYPSRQFKLYIGTARGVAPYIVDILNRIFDCDKVSVKGKLYTAAADKWDVIRIKNYPLVGASIDVVPSINERSLQFADSTPLAPGIIVAYQIQTAFFGKGGPVNVKEVEANS